MGKVFFTFTILVFFGGGNLLAQLYQGPADGMVTSGISVTTDTFSVDISEQMGNDFWSRPKKIHEHTKYENLDGDAKIPEKYINDVGIFTDSPVSDTNVILKNSFEGPSFFNPVPCWVPDCNVGVGPEDIIIPINTQFMITDKQGNVLKTITTAQWFSQIITSAGGLIFDPKIIYDKEVKRWIMLYLYVNSTTNTSYYLISVSDDSTAIGNWNIWTLPANLNGSAQVSNWADFPGMAIDEEALYITTDQYNFVGGLSSFAYEKLRIIRKSDLLNAEPDTVKWKDLWDIRYPQFPQYSAVVLRPVRLLSDLDGMLLLTMTHPALSGGVSSSVVLYKVIDALTNPSISSSVVSTMSFSFPPFARQLGGDPPLQTFLPFTSEMVYRNGKLYAVHTVASGPGNQFSSLHYLEIDVSASSVVQEFKFGADGSWYFIPAITVDANENVFVSYNRSSASDYAGLYFSVIPAGQSGFTGSNVIREGLGNLNAFCTGGTSGRLRWGDYAGATLDPYDETSVWVHGQYMGADNMWKTSVANMKYETVGINSEPGNIVPSSFELYQSYPNPFNPVTTVEYELSAQSEVVVRVFDASGKKIAELFNGRQNPGRQKLQWTGVNAGGDKAASGIYYLRVTVNGVSKSLKMALVK